MCPNSRWFGVHSVFFAGVDPRERLEFFGRGEVLYGVELELGFKIVCQTIQVSIPET